MNMVDYKTMMRMLGGSFSYEFDDGMQLTLTDYYSGDEAKLDFENMTEEMFEEMADTDDIEYDDAMRILRGSKSYEFDQSTLEVSDYHTGDTVRLDLSLMTEDMYEELSCDEEYDNDFEDSINSMDMEAENEVLL